MKYVKVPIYTYEGIPEEYKDKAYSLCEDFFNEDVSYTNESDISNMKCELEELGFIDVEIYCNCGYSQGDFCNISFSALTKELFDTYFNNSVSYDKFSIVLNHTRDKINVSFEYLSDSDEEIDMVRSQFENMMSFIKTQENNLYKMIHDNGLWLNEDNVAEYCHDNYIWFSVNDGVVLLHINDERELFEDNEE